MALLWYTIIGLGHYLWHIEIDPGLACFCFSVMWPLGLMLLIQTSRDWTMAPYPILEPAQNHTQTTTTYLST